MDGLEELFKANVRGKIYRLLHELNKDTRITVRTTVGDSEKRNTGENWDQGTIEGAIASAKNLDGGVNDFFQSSTSEFFFSSLRLQPILFSR